jgi:septum site-determining protein MinD
MGSIVTIHSYRGGTGKTNTSANLAVCLAMRGRRVAVIDTDVQSPGVSVLFSFRPSDFKLTLNDYLKGQCSIVDCALSVNDRLKLDTGELYLIPSALLSSEIVRIIKSGGLDVEKITEAFRQSLNDLKLDYLIVDTHPGLAEDTMLYAVMSHLLLILLRTDQQDYLGTSVLVELSRRLTLENFGLVISKLLPTYDLQAVRTKLASEFNCPVLGVLPFDVDVMANESASVMVLDRKDHPWTRAVNELAETVIATTSAPAKVTGR